MLGLYLVQPQGCHYRIEITFEMGLHEVTQAVETLTYTPRPVQAGTAVTFTPTRIHHSDAKGSPSDLVRAAEARGLEVLAITDHNTASHHRALAQQRTPLLLIPGQELTTSRGHVNVWGETGWMDFRLTQDADLPKLIKHVHESGGLFSINHPKDTGYNWHYPVPEHFDALEVWQSAWAYCNWESVAFADSLLREGRRFTFVGGSDRHQPGWPDTDPLFLQVGTPMTWLYITEWTVAGVLAALRNGRTYLSESPTGPRLELTVAGVPMGGAVPRSSQVQRVKTSVTGAAGCTLRYLSDEGVVRVAVISDDTCTDSWW